MGAIQLTDADRLPRAKRIIKGSIRVLLIGNNPIELSPIYDALNNFSKKKFKTEIAFNIHDSILKAIKFKPRCIVLDDNVERENIRTFMEQLRGDERTAAIPVTLMKNSNRSESFSAGIQDFVLKENLTTDRIARSIFNAIRYSKTQRFLFNTYYKNKSKVLNFFNEKEAS